MMRRKNTLSQIMRGIQTDISQAEDDIQSIIDEEVENAKKQSYQEGFEKGEEIGYDKGFVEGIVEGRRKAEEEFKKREKVKFT